MVVKEFTPEYFLSIGDELTAIRLFEAQAARNTRHIKPGKPVTAENSLVQRDIVPVPEKRRKHVRDFEAPLVVRQAISRATSARARDAAVQIDFMAEVDQGIGWTELAEKGHRG